MSITVDDFYLNLPSNSPHKTKENRTSYFTVELPHEICLQGDWVCGLYSASIPNTFWNFPVLPKELNTIVIYRERARLAEHLIHKLNTNKNTYRKYINEKLDIGRDILGYKTFTSEEQLPAGNYDSITDLINAVNIQIKKSQCAEDRSGYHIGERFTRCVYLKKIRRVYFRVSAGDTIILPEYLARLFRIETQAEKVVDHGYVYGGTSISPIISAVDERIHTHKPSSSRAFNALDLLKNSLLEKENYNNVYKSNGIPMLHTFSRPLYIYTDIISYEVVGNVRTKLLKRIQPREKFGEIIECLYAPPQYKKLSTYRFSEIEIIIRNDLGELVAFEYGDVFLVLHFKQIK